jgi:hypothetical protein
MYVQQIEILSLSHGRHLGRQRQGVRLMLEQRIRHHLDFVKTHPLVQLSQTRRQRRGDEVHRMAARREFFAQLRTDDAAAAVGWIDCDADVHSS